MNLKNVAVFLDARSASIGRLEFAIALALRQEAALTAVWVELPPATTQSEGAAGFARGAALGDFAERYAEFERAARLAVDARLERARHAEGLRSDVRVLPLQSQASDAVLQARYTDLAVLAQPAHKADNHPYGWSAEDVIREAGVPLVIVPAVPERAGYERVAIAWNASIESHRAVADAMPLLQTATHVRVLIANATTGARSHGEEPGADIARHLAKHDIDVEVTRVEEAEGSLARIILDSAEAFAADLIVSGAFGHSRMSEFIFGSTTRELLTGSRVPLLLSR